jgi:hypothetical protein
MKLTNPYIRAAATRPELAQEAAIKLEEREAEPELIRARDEQGRFIADDPATPQDEAWVLAK